MPGLAQIYGLTESAGIVTCSFADDPNQFSTVGLPLDGFEIRFADRETRRPVSPNEVGQVEIKSRFVMRGYLDNLEETRKTMTTDGWLQTISGIARGWKARPLGRWSLGHNHSW
jgi:long-subunit acyl-CoA synthetase (AMP-forming)